ncbi:MAG: hypothetical protein H7222_13975 [Methylotenera sp.]|nr:hypothetical protein [Oligoflexia bacterium]
MKLSALILVLGALSACSSTSSRSGPQTGFTTQSNGDARNPSPGAGNAPGNAPEKTYEAGVISPSSNELEALERRGERDGTSPQDPNTKRQQAGKMAPRSEATPKPAAPESDPSYETESDYENAPTN